MTAGSASRAATNPRVRFARSAARQVSSSASAGRAAALPAAFATRMSRLPRATCARRQPGRRWRSGVARARSPPISAATASSGSRVRPLTATGAPSAANRRAIAAPIPCRLRSRGSPCPRVAFGYRIPPCDRHPGDDGGAHGRAVPRRPARRRSRAVARRRADHRPDDPSEARRGRPLDGSRLRPPARGAESS